MNKVVKIGLAVGGVLLGIGIYLTVRANKISQPKFLDPKVSDPDLNKKFNFELIPDGKGNYRSAQFTAEQLPYIIKKYNIKRIIRLNGDGSDSRHRSSYPETSRATEEVICKSNGCEFNYIYGGQGYIKNQGYVTSLNKVKAVLDKGNTLIHCAHGQDRTGGMVGGYLKKGGYMTNIDDLWNYTTNLNGWVNMIRRGTFFGSGFDKYADTFYPIDLLKKKYGK
jgi:hypothetical protein